MNILSVFINNIHKLPSKSYQKFLAITELKKFHKNDILTKTGDIPTHLYILKRGIVRSYYEDEKGKEYIRSLFVPYCSTGSFGALVSNKSSLLTYQCLTDCELYSINYKKLKKLASADIDIAVMYANALESVFLLFEKKIYNLSVLDATERYKAVKKEIPNIENIIPQYHIASYLNISAVQLSRIRKKLNSK
ncbi:Crp/Fnr family transcriptional regulator [Polaribacter sp. Z014]|uniref:Crp/Fnr family transcriptional regulator n=1 Tax=Polaribacter sp. Z014 TaxID=2927126 RepID=UPI0032E437D8